MHLDGSTRPGFEPVRDTFAEIVTGLSGTGAAVAAWRDGAYVVDLWGGWADAAKTKPWRADTLAHPYSVTKPFAAVCVLVLVDRGVVGLDDDVRRYWPELESKVTVRQLLAHQSGLVALDDPAPTQAFYDWDRMCDLLASQPPSWEPGTSLGEAALFYGHPLGQIVRRVDGRTLGQFLRDEVCVPLGLDFHIGLDASEHHRVVELTGFDLFGPEFSEGHPQLFDRALRNPVGALEADVVNAPQWRSAEVPAVNGLGTARAVSGFYAALASGDLLSPTLLAEATSVVASGEDQVMGSHHDWGLGFSVDEYGFGMGGIGGHFGAWDSGGEYAFAFVRGTLGDFEAAEMVENTFRSCLGLAPLAD
jgi:CubicO group peptidase (beta-lactamase class C family)